MCLIYLKGLIKYTSQYCIKCHKLYDSVKGLLLLVVLAIILITIYIVINGENLAFDQAFYTFFWSLYVLQEGYVSGILVTNQLSGRRRRMWRKSLSFTSPVKSDFHFLPLHTIPNTCRRRFARLSQNGERQIYVVYYILMVYVCQFQKGKVHFCSSTGVKMSSQNIHSIFGPNLF